MPQIQARLDLPQRKTRSKGTPVKIEEVSGGEENAPPKTTRRRGLLQPIEDPEKLLRTPRSRRKAAAATNSEANTPSKATQSASKRSASGTKELEKSLQVSPSKQTRTPLKQIKDLKENVPVGLSPCSGLSKLALSSPKTNLSAKKSTKDVSKASKADLFKSPPKLTSDDVLNLLNSPEKSKTPMNKSRTPVRRSLNPTPTKARFPTKSPRQLDSNQLEDLLCSPKATKTSSTTSVTNKAASNLFSSPVKSTRTPVKDSKPTITPVKDLQATSALFPSKSPRRVTSQQLEDLLCSPVKSPVPKLPTKSPRKPATPSKLGSSPIKRTSLFSPAKKPAASPAATKPAGQLFQADISQFQQARAALHTGTPSHLMCREEQVGVMTNWLDKHLVSGNPGSMYVSGAPGTGKTATLSHLLATKVKKEYKSIFINCMVLKSSIAIYREVAKQLNPKKVAKTEKDALKVIEDSIRTSKMMILLVLDEVDQLESKDQSVLYTVFEWPALQSSKLVLVGIANSLDLTDRVLPRLQVSPAYKPTLLHYPPYTKQEIMDIITARLKEGAKDVSGQSVITPRAIAFLAGKIASLSGDLRKALDVCRRALELSETIARKQTLLKPMNPRALASPSKSPRKGYLNPKALPQVGQVDVPQIMKVINQVYGSQVSASLGTKGDGLPLKQKILIASLLLMVKKGKSKEVTLGKLAETYSKVLKKRQMDPEHESACVGMIQMLESRGMVTYLCKGAPRLAKVSLRMDEDEVSMALGDKSLLAAILEDTACIAK